MNRTATLRNEMVQARAKTDQLLQFISPEALYERPITDRHRLVFYLGHLEAFDWHLLARRASSEAAFHPTFDNLFERGIDPEPGKAPSDTANDWPKRREIEEYNRQTRDWIDKRFLDLDPVLLQMAIEHRYMHAETFAYLMHNLPYEQKLSGPLPEVGVSKNPPNPLIEVPAGVAKLGKGHEGFGWDNEYLAHDVAVQPFLISKFKVSNREYLQYVNEGGAPPHFWSLQNDRWMYRGMFGMVPLPPDHPVWVTWAQANAFAAWRGMQLPTEAQFTHAAETSPQNAARDNFGFHHFDPIPVDAAGNTGWHPQQLVGNGWEWTQDVFAPFEGFEAHPFYPGYSADFFDNQHYVMKGASPRTASILTRPSFRNWFRPEYPHMYAGFRLVEE